MNKVERDKLIEENLETVYVMANKYINKIKGRYELDELVSEGFLGLDKAIKTFNTSKDIKFSTWASRNIEYKIKDLLFKDSRYRKCKKVDGNMVWEDVDISSLNIPVSEEVQDEKVNQLEDEFQWQKVDENIVVEEQLSKLSNIDREMLEDYYIRGMKQKEISEKYDISRSYVSMQLSWILDSIKISK